MVELLELCKRPVTWQPAMVIYIPDISENNDPYYSLSCISFADFKSNYNFDQFLFSDHFLIVHSHFLLKSIIALLCEVCLYPG